MSDRAASHTRAVCVLLKKGGRDEQALLQASQDGRITFVRHVTRCVPCLPFFPAAKTLRFEIGIIFSLL